MFAEHDAFGDDCWILTLTEYIRDVVKAHKKPVVGICFGHQVLARALGARVSRGEGWEISSSQINLTDAGKELFGQDQLVSKTVSWVKYVLTGDSIYTKCTATLSTRCQRDALILAIVAPAQFKVFIFLTGY
jgi:anthranilate/para-aminobenzoate synthase component II